MCGRERPGSRFPEVPKSFRARKATTKILNLKFKELFFSHNFNTNKVNFPAKFNAYTLLSFLDADHRKWLYGPNKLTGLTRNGPLARLKIRLGALEILTIDRQVIDSCDFEQTSEDQNGYSGMRAKIEVGDRNTRIS